MTIEFTQGNLITSQAEAKVITVNCVGVMGKGLALQAKQEWPGVYDIYRRYCQNALMRPGKLIPIELDLDHEVILAATKDDWRHPSQMTWIRSIISALAAYCQEWEISTMAVPPLGCGHWNDVRPLLVTAFTNHPTHALIYGPEPQAQRPLGRP